MSEAIRDLRHDKEVLNDRIDGLNVVIISMQRRLARIFEEQRALKAHVNASVSDSRAPPRSNL